MAFGQNTGRDPKGNAVLMPVGGTAFISTAPLQANASVSTGWLPTAGYLSALYVIQSNKIGTISAVEYSNDGVTVSSSGTGRPYPKAGKLFQIALALKDSFFRITYTNGAEKQNTFSFEVRLSTQSIQGTMGSVYIPITETNMAAIVKSVIELDADGTGNFGQVFRTGNSLNTHVTNFPTEFKVNNLPAEQKIIGSGIGGAVPVSGNVGITSNTLAYQVAYFNYGVGTITGIQTIRTSPGYLGGIIATNTGKTDAFIQFFDMTGTPVLGAASYPMPLTFGMPLMFPVPIEITNSLRFAITTTYNGTSPVPQVISFLHRSK